MSTARPVAIRVEDGRDLGYAVVPETIIEQLRDTLAGGPLARALGSAVLVASELNLAQLREGTPAWAPDKGTLAQRLMLSEHPARATIDALEQAGMVSVERGRWAGTTRLPNRLSLLTTDGAFCAVTRRAIAAIADRCMQEKRSRPHALAVYVTLVWLANQQRAEHSEPRRRATASYPKIASLSGVSEPQTRRVVKDLMACGALEDVSAKTNGTRVAKTWRLVEPRARVSATAPVTVAAGPVSQAPRPDPACATARSHERHGPIPSAPPSNLGCAIEGSQERHGPLTGAPTRARATQQSQQTPGTPSSPEHESQPGGEGETPKTPDTDQDPVSAVIDAMIAMLARRAGGNEQRARRRAEDPRWTQAARELIGDGYSVEQLTELMAVAETDIALGHRITCLPSLNEHFDALQARHRAASGRLITAAGTASDDTGIDAVIELVIRTLQQAPPRANRREHLDAACSINAGIAEQHAGFLAELPWHQLGQRDHANLRHAVLDAWRAHTHRRAA